MSGFAEALAHALAAHGRAVVVAIAHGQGSVPREPGAWMIVTAAGQAGTIGGGHLEHEAGKLAREALGATTPPATWLVRFPLAARLGQCCGGVATVAFAVVGAEESPPRSAQSAPPPDGAGHLRAALRSPPWLDVAQACERTSADFALVHRLGADRDRAQRLVVTGDDSRGSLGDDALDSAAVVAARARLAPGGTTGVADVAGASLFLHVVRADAFDVALFGNGHVARALVKVLAALPCRVRWIDERVDDFPGEVPANVEIVATDATADEVADLPRGAYLVVTTHLHALDFAIVEKALERDDLAYVGLIGSASKRAQLARRLAQRGGRGDPEAALARVTCPIGTGAGLASKEPGAIAVGIAAEILAVREKRAAVRRDAGARHRV